MRPIMIAVIAAVAVLAADGSRAQESFFNWRYCTIPGGAFSGSSPDCSYNTLAQCRASIGPSTKYCAENPNWKPEGGSDRSRRRNG